jgi:prepilin-type N-terminal cleavage/methylation domain-containing protein
VENRIHLLYHRKMIKKMIRNQKGFSLIEILVVVALSSVVVLGNSLFMSDFIARMDEYSKESAEESELAVLNTMALNILKKSSLSFNRLAFKDDNNLNFFDFYPDMPLGSFNGEERKFTLDTLAEKFYILSSDEGKFSSTVFDPVHAYTVTSPPSPVDALADGTTAYRGINSVPDLTNASGGKATAKMMSQIFSTRWAAGKIFVVTCPTYLRPVSSPSATVSLGTAPRMPSFVGTVSGDDLLPITTGVGVTIINTHPVTGAAYGDLDGYFRTLPTVGGAAPFVKIEPAIISRFELRTVAGYPSGVYDLYLLNWTADGYAEAMPVATKISKVTFKRKSVTFPIISMEIEK